MEGFMSWDVEARGSSEKVGMNENGMAVEGTVYADDLGSCLGIGIHDRESEIAYLSHVGVVNRENYEISSQMMRFVSNIDETDDVQVLLTGGGYYEREDEVSIGLENSIEAETFRIGGWRELIDRGLRQMYGDSSVETYVPRENLTEIEVDAKYGISTVTSTYR